MLIGIDKDDVLFATKEHFLQYYNRKHRTAYVLEDILIDDPCAFLGISRRKMLFEYLDFKRSTNQFIDIAPVEGAVDAISQIRNKGHDLIVVSSTPKLLEGRTHDSINHYFDDAFQNIHCLDSLTFIFGMLGLVKRDEWKYQKYKELNVEVVIEDSLEISERCSSCGIRTFLLDYPWNRRYVEGIERVSCWDEIIEKLK